jgi:phenylacetate-CoA ligase
MAQILTSIKDALWLSRRFVSAFLRPRPNRYGPVFWQTYQFLLLSEKWSADELQAFQFRRVKSIISDAYEKSSFYRSRFQKANVTPNDLECLADIRLFPFLEKTDIKNNLDQIAVLSYPKRERIYVTTGGTTGVPVGIYLHKTTDAMRLAFEWRQFSWGNHSWRDRCVVIRGRVMQNRLIQYDPVDNYLYLSAFDLTHENMRNYLRAIKSFKPSVIRAYPSAAEILARYVLEEDPGFNQDGAIKAIFTSSEALYGYQKSLIEKAFKAKIFDKYGNSEQASIIGMCGYGDLYHDAQEYALTEILDENDNPVTKEGGIGEIVSTPFTNPVTPLIRYRTGDFAQVTFRPCPCGRAHRRVKKILGRSQDYLEAIDGSRISVAALNTHQNVFDHVWRFRYLQTKPGEAVIQIVKTDVYSDKDESEILREARFRSKDKIVFRVEYVDTLSLSKRGKFSFIQRAQENREL